MKPDTENGNAPAPGIPVSMTNSYGNGSPSMTNSINENENKVQDNRVNNPAALPTQNNPPVTQSAPKTQTKPTVTPKNTTPDPRTLEAFNKNEFPIYIHTSPLSCITYQPVLDGETVEDLLCHVRTEANIPSAVKSSFCLFRSDNTFEKLERIEDTADLTELFSTLNSKKQPLVLGRWNVFDDQILNSGEETKNLIFNEQKLREKFKDSENLESIKDDDEYDAWEFEPCTCDLRTDGSLISLQMNPAVGVILGLIGTTTKLTILWEHILSHQVLEKEGNIFSLSYQRPGKPEKTLKFTSKQSKLMEDVCSFMN